MIEMEELDDSDAEMIIEEIHNLKLNFTFFPSIPTRYIRRPKKKEESVDSSNFLEQELEFHCDKNCNSHKTFN